MDQTEQNKLKALVGQEAVKYVKDGMLLGLGTGSTVRYMVDALGKRVKDEGLNITAATTSTRTTKQAESLGIKIVSLDSLDHLDLVIDGADEISDDFQGIKGGGGALLWEKIVANTAKKYMWIVDESKLVHKLGKFPLPVEVIPFGSVHVFNRLEKMGYKPTWRMDGDKKFLTDEKNYIIDLHLGEIDKPHELYDKLIKMVGVVEVGLFLDRVNDVIVGTAHGPVGKNAR